MFLLWHFAPSSQSWRVAGSLSLSLSTSLNFLYSVWLTYLILKHHILYTNMVHAWPTNSSANLKLVLDKSPRWERKLGWEQHATLGSLIPKWSIIFARNNLTIGQLKGFVNFESLKSSPTKTFFFLCFFFC